MGKTSTESRFNIPGKIGWATMEAPGFMTLLYIMFTLPAQNGIERLPMANWIMAGLFVCFILLLHDIHLLRYANSYTDWNLKDDPLHLPRPTRTPLPQPLHVPHPRLRLVVRSRLPAYKRHLHRRLPCLLWSPHHSRLGWARGLHRVGHDDFLRRTGGEYLSR